MRSDPFPNLTTLGNKHVQRCTGRKKTILDLLSVCDMYISSVHVKLAHPISKGFVLFLDTVVDRRSSELNITSLREVLEIRAVVVAGPY
jgi:hypothetical protein